MIIGVTGTDGGGKGTVVEYLVQKKGFMHCSARALWVDEINKRGLEVNRANMRLMGNDLRAQHGDDFLIEEYKRRTGFKPEENYVIESIRATAEANALKKYGGALWAVDADPKVRYERIQSRASESDKISFEEFVVHEALEMNDPDPHGMQKAKVMAMADATLTNNGTQEELFAQVENALQKPRKTFIDKLAFIEIRDQKVLETRSRGKETWYIPGGKREEGESDEQALIREMKEELLVDIIPETIKHYGTFEAQAHGKSEGTVVRMTCYTAEYKGELTPSAEVEKMDWFTYADRDRVSPVDQMIFDDLKSKGLID